MEKSFKEGIKMKIFTIGRLQIIIELQPKKDPRALEKLMLMRQRPMKMTEDEYIKRIENMD